MANSSITKLATEVESLQREVRTLRSLIIAVLGKDPEGDYNPAFVRRVLKAAKEKPTHVFKDGKSFLSQLKTA